MVRRYNYRLSLNYSYVRTKMCNLSVSAVCAGPLIVAGNWTEEELINAEEERSLTTQSSSVENSRAVISKIFNDRMI